MDQNPKVDQNLEIHFKIYKWSKIRKWTLIKKNGHKSKRPEFNKWIKIQNGPKYHSNKNKKSKFQLVIYFV